MAVEAEGVCAKKHGTLSAPSTIPLHDEALGVLVFVSLDILEVGAACVSLLNFAVSRGMG